MSIPVKVQCGCGQRYAFDVEPVNARMPGPVACPVCGADGTAAANEIIAQSLSAQPVVAAKPAGVVRLGPPPPSIRLATEAAPAQAPAQRTPPCSRAKWTARRPSTKPGLRSTGRPAKRGDWLSDAAGNHRR